MKIILMDILKLIPFAIFAAMAVATNVVRDKGKRPPEKTGLEEEGRRSLTTDKQVKWLKGKIEAEIATSRERYKKSNQSGQERNSCYWYGRRDGLEFVSKVLSRIPSAEELEKEEAKGQNGD